MAFKKRLQQNQSPALLREVVTVVSGFLTPILGALFSGTKIPKTWTAQGPWI
jgi:hypothetical protein